MLSRVDVVTPPANTTLVSLASAQAEIGSTTAAENALITALIAEATTTLKTCLSRPIVRGQYKERTRGSRFPRQGLSVRPIASLDVVELGGVTQTLSDFSIEDPGAGIITRDYGGYGSTEIFWDSYRDVWWEFTTTAGYFVDADDVTDTLSVDDTDDSYNAATALFPVHLKPGDLIRASGFTDAANNGTKTVATATTTKITVDQTLVTEGAAAARTVAVSNLPGDIRRSVMSYVRSVYFSPDHPALVGESIEGVGSLRWASPDQARSASETMQGSLGAYLDI